MRRHSGLGRRGALADGAGDPLDGLVNLFDLGIVLAIAFLVAGVSIALDHGADASHARSAAGQLPPSSRGGTSAGAISGAQSLPSPNGAAKAAGHGRPVGTVYRLSDGRLVYVRGR
ncbi:MAG TPA: DUF2149 domain-containing protein [Solirubrobacteraceae bacterium]|nr:DUF2149 domain-containing protein [Solirubrobacteraceae bacterium]